MAAPSDFDAACDALANDASRLVYDWFLHSRTAAALMGQGWLSLYPSPGLHSGSSVKTPGVRLRSGKGYAVDGVTIESDLEAIFDCFVRQQYRLEGRV